MDTQVLVIGAGPVGLTLAIDLGLRGVRCTLIEQKMAPAKLPKMERCNARTMEIYRRMGIAKQVRGAGPTAGQPRCTVPPLRLSSPSRVPSAPAEPGFRSEAFAARCVDGSWNYSITSSAWSRIDCGAVSPSSR